MTRIAHRNNPAICGARVDAGTGHYFNDTFNIYDKFKKYHDNNGFRTCEACWPNRKKINLEDVTI